MVSRILKRLYRPENDVATNSTERWPADIDPATIDVYRDVSPFTMTSIERVAALVDSVNYVAQNRIPGDIVECGVWRGGSMMAAAMTLIRAGDTSRRLYLFDTFDGMSEPSQLDVDFRNVPASVQLASDPGRAGDVWARATLADVTANLNATRYPRDLVLFVPGRVEETVPQEAPTSIALLRLDTDWYESTRHELRHLYPRLSAGGVLLIDDYGHWQGARKAVDEYFAECDCKPLLVRIDNTARLAIKP